MDYREKLESISSQKTLWIICCCLYMNIFLSVLQLRPHHRHLYGTAELTLSQPVSHVRLIISPDGGVSRLRLWGRPVPITAVTSASQQRPASKLWSSFTECFSVWHVLLDGSQSFTVLRSFTLLFFCQFSIWFIKCPKIKKKSAQRSQSPNVSFVQNQANLKVEWVGLYCKIKYRHVQK